MRQPYIYLSYEGTDAEFAHHLRGLLEKSRFTVWMDAEPNPSEEWLMLIEGQIETCTVFLGVLSPAAQQSAWVAEEFNLAAEYDKPISAVLYSGEIESVNFPVIDMRGKRGKRLPASLHQWLCQYFACPDDQRNGHRWWRWW